jgi:hypothetical protein
MLSMSIPRSFITFFISGFVGTFTLEYRANTRSLPEGTRRLEADVVKTFPDEKRRLEWYKIKAAELDQDGAEDFVENEAGKGGV